MEISLFQAPQDDWLFSSLLIKGFSWSFTMTIHTDYTSVYNPQGLKLTSLLLPSMQYLQMNCFNKNSKFLLSKSRRCLTADEESSWSITAAKYISLLLKPVCSQHASWASPPCTLTNTIALPEAGETTQQLKYSLHKKEGLQFRSAGQNPTKRWVCRCTPAIPSAGEVEKGGSQDLIGQLVSLAKSVGSRVSERSCLKQ